jgi:DNA replication protein DnaC
VITSVDTPASVSERIEAMLHAFKLPTAAQQLVPRLQEAGHEDALAVVCEVLLGEQEDRHERRVQRLRRSSRLPGGKTLATLEQDRLPAPLTRKLRELARGLFLERAVNVLAFGLPGTGKTHAACALGHALIEGGHAVLFTPTYQLVQHLLVAKRALDLPRALRQLDNYELLILDDIGYVQQEAQEVEVLFTLLAERYERKSVLITSNLVFSEWDRIFKNPMTTAAAIDRLVHHAEILEFDVPSYRTQGRAVGAAAEAQSTKKEAQRSAGR